MCVRNLLFWAPSARSKQDCSLFTRGYVHVVFFSAPDERLNLVSDEERCALD